MFRVSPSLYFTFKKFERPNTGVQFYKLITSSKGYNMNPIKAIEAIEDQKEKIVIYNRPMGFGRHAFLSMVDSYHDILQKKTFVSTFENTKELHHTIAKIPPNSKVILNLYFGSLQVDSEHFEKEFWGNVSESCRVFLQKYKDFLPRSCRNIDLYSNVGVSVLDQVLECINDGEFPCIVVIDDYNIEFHRNLNNISRILFTYRHGDPSNSHVFKGYIEDSTDIERLYKQFIDVLKKHCANKKIEKIIMGAVYPVDLEPVESRASLSDPVSTIEPHIENRSGSMSASLLRNDEKFVDAFAVTENTVKAAVQNFIPEKYQQQSLDLLRMYCGGYRFQENDKDLNYNLAQISHFLETAGKNQQLPLESELQQIEVYHPFLIEMILKSKLGCELLIKLCLARDDGLELKDSLLTTLLYEIRTMLPAITFSERYILSLMFHSGLITYAEKEGGNTHVRVTNKNAAFKIVDAMLHRLSWDALNVFQEVEDSVKDLLTRGDTSGIEEFFFKSQTREFGYSRWRNVEVTENSEQLLSIFLLFHLNNVAPTFDAHRNFSNEKGCADLVFFIPQYKTFIEYKNLFPFEVEVPSGREFRYSENDFRNRGRWDDGIAIDKEILELSNDDFLHLKIKDDHGCRTSNKAFSTVKDLKQHLNEEALVHLEEHLEVTGEKAQGFIFFQCGSRFKVTKVRENLYSTV